MAKKTIIYKNSSFAISYELVNKEKEFLIVILHGWGSNKLLMKQAFSPFLQNCQQLYIDLPGFGNSSEGDFVLTTQDYKNIISLFLESLKMQPHAIMGHSYGGKIATLLNPPLLILLSSAGILEKKPFIVKMKIALYKFLKPLGFHKIRSFFIADDAKKLSHNMYETFKLVVNEDCSDAFQNYQGEALIFWGDKDTATSLESGEKIAQFIKQSELIIYDGDHYFFLSHAKDIAQRIEQKCKTMNL